MNKILILLFAILCSLCMNAQNKSDFEKAIKNYNTQIPQLEKKYESIKANNARISKRSFVTETPDQSLRRRLAYYTNIKEMADLYKDKIPLQLYKAMYQYEVEISD